MLQQMILNAPATICRTASSLPNKAALLLPISMAACARETICTPTASSRWTPMRENLNGISIYDATETPVLVDANYQSQPRKLLA
jgi:hypothetical protein